ncbi:hypothetical protein ONZ45_g19596 [Pleurotus djamor]|nr:hypothetical protein ONZ45_g19596 [Pleurotus djamor]
MVLRSSKSPSPLQAETPSPDTRLAFFMHTRSFRKTPLPRRKASQKAKSTMLSPVPGVSQCIETSPSPGPAPGYYARKKSQVALMKGWRRRH